MAEDSRFRVTADDIRDYDWRAVISSVSDRECFHYHEAFLEKSRDLEVAGDDRGSRVFALLSVVSSFHPNYDKKVNPYGPLWRDGQRRALMAEDLANEDLDALAGILPDLDDPELCARIGDLLWECRKDFRAAQVAIDAFVRAAAVLETGEMWSPFVDRLERGLQLAAKTGFGKELHKKVLAVAEDTVSRYGDDQKSGLLCARLMSLLLSHRAGDPVQYAALSERIAKRNAGAREWNFAYEYYELCATWHRKANNREAAQKASVNAAETHASKAEANLAGKQPSFMFAAHWMGQAVESLRQAKGSSERIETLHKRFLELEHLSLGEMKTIEIIPEHVHGLKEAEEVAREASRKHVSGIPLEDAIFRFAFMIDPTNPAALRKQVEQQAKESPFAFLFGSNTVSGSGKVTDRAPSMAHGSSTEIEEAVWKELFQQARTIR